MQRSIYTISEIIMSEIFNEYSEPELESQMATEKHHNIRKRNYNNVDNKRKSFIVGAYQDSKTIKDIQEYKNLLRSTVFNTFLYTFIIKAACINVYVFLYFQREIVFIIFLSKLKFKLTKLKVNSIKVDSRTIHSRTTRSQ